MKVLISADIHVDDYSDFNFRPKSRLKQFDTLADRLVEIGKSYDCEEHWILGDIVNRPNSRKYIEHAVKNFLKKQSENFNKVRYILGQHDVESKSQDLNIEDTLISLFDFDNFIYMHREIKKMGDKTFGFMNWMPNQDLEWVGDEHLDVLFGHYTKSNLFGQDIDESKFDLMIHGDIHNDQKIGKFVSVGNPIQHDMKSLDNGSCIIFDTETLEWERVRVDEDHTRFLRMGRTSDRALEGFRGELQYNVYTPELSKEDEDKSKTLEWDTIEDLITKTCEEHGLTDIHGEVEAKCVPYSEVDFNFQLNWIRIKGYRSIADLELEFSKDDLVALFGENGSGKSSIVKALRGVFLKNSHLKHEQSDFTDEMDITVNLTYQNKIFEITKGTRWHLSIDSEEQSYNGITAFENDIYRHLPFIDYLDLFFITSDVQNLSAQFNPTRRIQLISKFYRLDRIDAYWSTGMNLYNELNEKITESSGELNTQIGILNHMKSRLEELKEFESVKRDDLLEVIKSYQDLRDKYQLYQLWLRDDKNLRIQLNEAQGSVDDMKKKSSFDIKQGEIDLEILKDKSKKAEELYEENYKSSIQFESDLREITSLEKEGEELKVKLDALKRGKCPECGNKLSSKDHLQKQEEYELSIRKFRERWIELDNILEGYPKQRESKSYFVKLLQNLKTSHKEIKDHLELLTNKINQYNISKSNLEVSELRLEKIKELFSENELKKPAEVKLPLDLSTKELEANSKLSKFDEYHRHMDDMKSQEEKIEALESEIKDSKDKLLKYDEYIALTSNSGFIYEEILKILAIKFTTDDVKYEVESGVFRGNRFINFNSFYLNAGRYRIYESCSDGQKIVCDLDFISKLFSVNVGLLVLDEYLKHLDESNFAKACEILGDLNVNTVILSTHDNNLSIYTRRLLLSQNEKGETVCDHL